VKKAIVTGAESGIGAACVARLRREGVETVSFDLAPGAGFRLDVSDGPAVNAAVAQVGPVDILVNSAGIIGPNKQLWEITDDEWQQTVSVNVNGVFNMCRAVVPGMRERGWGRIVNIASIAGKEGNPNLSAYSASKGAVGITAAPSADSRQGRSPPGSAILRGMPPRPPPSAATRCGRAPR
jgi:NAD(P)-dependent dehydrogenase (short-subunit alcohol dehydrogenase family)